MTVIAKILFVCLGNICRSPLAEAAMRQAIAHDRLPIEVDSAGTGDWHVGKPPDRRAQKVAQCHGVDIGHYRARQVSPADFMAFTHIVALDAENFRDLERIRPPDATAEMSLLLDHVAGRAGESVADPYFGEFHGFEVAWADVTAGAQGLLAALMGEGRDA